MSDNNNQRRPTTRSEANPDLLTAPLNPARRVRTPTHEEEGPSTQSSNMAEEATRALTDALQSVRVSSRKPEIPAFDSKNVDLWLKRVANAYRRSGITDSKDKFAFIEPKFAVDSDPRINELLFGDGTPEKWDELEEYLRGRYGRTKAQQAAVILDGEPRAGKLPSEMFARIKEQIGQITIDDVIKEMVLRELPTDVRRTIHDKAENLDGAATVKLADAYFDRNGMPIHAPPSQPINVVEEVPGLIDTDDESETSAVYHFNKTTSAKGRATRPQQAGKNRQPSSLPASQPFSKPFTQRPQPSGRQPAPRNTEWQTVGRRPSIKTITLCKWHTQFGKSAYTCEAGCDKYTGRQTGNDKAGRQT